MKSGRRTSTLVAGMVSGAVVAAIAVLGVTPARAATTSPFDPSGNGATNGTLSFYDASGNVITHGPLGTAPAYAAADSYTGRPGDTIATLYGFTPESAKPTDAWQGVGMSTPAALPASGLPGGLAGTTHAVASGIPFWFDAGGYPSALPNTDSNAAWQGLYQLRLYTSGPGQGVDTTVYPSATIAVDVTAGEWTQIYPTPVAPPAPNDATTTTIESVTPATTASTTTPIQIKVAVADSTTPATIPTGSVTVKADGASLGTPTLDATGHASVSIPASILAVGPHALTAEYTPTGAFNASTTSSSTTYSITLAAPANITSPSASVARVGVISSCNAGVWTYAGTYSFAWYLDASAAPFANTARTAALPAGYAGHTVTCKVTAANPTGAVTTASAPVKVALGAAPRTTIRPTIVGVARGYALRGRTMKAKVGKWVPAPAGYRYTWKLSGRVVSHATALRIASTWTGKTLVLVVTTVKSGYLTGTAVSLTARIK